MCGFWLMFFVGTEIDKGFLFHALCVGIEVSHVKVKVGLA